MFKRPWFIFLTGLSVGAGAVGFFWFANIIGQAFTAWEDVQVYFDGQAIKKMDAKFVPSASSRDAYYYIDGFLDHRVFLAYTDSLSHLDGVVLSLTGKRLADLEIWRDQLKDESFMMNGEKVFLPNYHREPGALGKKWLTSLYDVDVIQRGRFFQKNEGSWGWHLIVDEDTGRFYYHSWTT
ncbi:hypothetical protein WJU23_06605 [Prosthecobacter sp. SYSU 5D2]|uniref:hypothetical protein n=1 Tax=Prosthecobacter sp. SYSU 5D2 TaxID=3134134 RepID=UPI0031FEF345